MSKTVTWICDIKAPSGYGRAARADLQCLVEAGVTPQIKIRRHDHNQVVLDRNPFWKEHLESMTKPGRHPEIMVWQETPEFYRIDPTCKHVSRIEWETSRVVDWDHNNDPTHNWVRQLNAMAEIWPASEFTAKA